MKLGRYSFVIFVLISVAGLVMGARALLQPIGPATPSARNASREKTVHGVAARCDVTF